GDLAGAPAVAGATLGLALEPRAVVIGELGLGGEVRSVPQLERRLGEAARLGYTRAVVPASAASHPEIETLPACDLGDALALGLVHEIKFGESGVAASAIVA